MFLLDTDHCVFLLRRSESVCREFERRSRDGAAISIITAGELFYGAHRSTRADENLIVVRRFLGLMAVLPLTMDTMERFAHSKAQLERQGRKLEDPDLLIAATAMERDLILVTHNKAHYERIVGLRLEDWHR